MQRSWGDPVRRDTGTWWRKNVLAPFLDALSEGRCAERCGCGAGDGV